MFHEGSLSRRRNYRRMKTLENTHSLAVRLRGRLCETAMLELAQRLIAIPSENPPGNHYEDCARTLLEELDKLGFRGVKREGACVVASVGTGSRTLYFSGHYDVVIWTRFVGYERRPGRDDSCRCRGA
jgi:hypothetical protein